MVVLWPNGIKHNNVLLLLTDAAPYIMCFNTVMSIRDILLNKTPNNKYSEIEYTPKEIMCMKYAPVTSVDVERSFSRYKAMLRPNRRHYTFENFKLYVVSNCFPHEDYDESE
ncbi:unnamed protein product [Macrosiphum euphorbiae]|uniref:HAT C-terminal dimerisation domain-containing protein n=1 Tax=Macrosiphum euphorbiae TaxID=13131 RepID=A0AAV0XYH9_9HEMI|nr:unnamed protein product [Macrosiphum euphorbiae]